MHIHQSKGRRGFVDIAQQLVEEGLVLFAAHAEPCPGHEVAKRQRRGQMPSFTEQMCVDFLFHDFQCGVVERQVVEQVHRHPAPVERIVGDAHMH